MKDSIQSRQWLIVIAGIFVWMLVVLVGPACAEAGTAYTSQNPLVLKVSVFLPSQVPMATANMWTFHEVEKRSKGRLKFEYYWSGTLIPARETLTGLRDKVADIGALVPGYFPGKLPLGLVTALPMTGAHVYPTAMAAAEFWQTPEMAAELAKYNVRYFSIWQNSSYGIWSTFPVHSIADLKGKKVATTGEFAVLMKHLGAVPIGMVATETYTAMQRGTVDFSVANPSMGFGYKWQEVCPYYFNLYIGNKGLLFAINIDSWNKIPSDIQQMFPDLRDQASRIAHEIYEGGGEKMMAEAIAKGTMKLSEPSAEDVALARKAAKETVWKEWVEKMEKRGLPGQKVLDNYLKLLKKWEARSPFKK